MSTDLQPFTINDLRRLVGTPNKTAMLTCYDYTTATQLTRAGVPMLLVGDSAASVILGHASTLPVTLDFLITLTCAVKRGAPKALVVGDLPFGSYHASDAQAVESACRMIKESDCDAVKLEVGPQQLSAVKRLAGAGVAVIAHLGLRPQSVSLLGGYRYQGRTAAEAQQIVDACRAFADAGAAAILLEAVPPEVSARVVRDVCVPVIGCGAGPACHAHVVVLQDLLKQTPRQAKFVPDTGPDASVIEIATRYVSLIATGAYPAPQHCYAMPEAERALFMNQPGEQITV